MKKFLAFSISLFLVICLVIFNLDYLREKKENHVPVAHVEGKQISVGIEDLNIVGMNLNASWPGESLSENNISEKKYMQWFKEMRAMHVNSIRVNKIMPNTFYNALKKYNENHSKPLYLLQSIPITREDLKKQVESTASICKYTKERIEQVVDVVHGHYTPFVNVSEDRVYNADVSDWLLGYSLSNDLSYDDYLYAEVMLDQKSYKGDFIKSSKKASLVETYMAKLADKVLSYEYQEYSKKSLLTITSLMDDVYKSIDKPIDEKGKRFLDMNNIELGPKNDAGIFVSYNMALSGSEAVNLDKMELMLNKLVKYHKYPVVVSEYGIPTSRISNDYMIANNMQPFSEQDQGKQLIKMDKIIRSSGCAGGYIYEFCDDWYAKSSNMDNAYREKIDAKYLSVNNNSTNQHFGIKKYVEDKNNGVGENISDWTSDEIVQQNDDIALYARETTEGLSLLVRFNDVFEDDDTIYINLDILPKGGSTTMKGSKIKFDKPSEFVVELNKKEGQILVNNYYDLHKYKESMKELRNNPNKNIVDKNTNEFEIEKVKLKDRYYHEESKSFVEAKHYDYGKLVEGDSSDNSLADYHIGDDYAEILIPWDMLNFVDPSKHIVYEDLYSNDGNKRTKIYSINMGVNIQRRKHLYRLKDGKFKLNDWKNIDVEDVDKAGVDELSRYFKKVVCK